MDRSILRAKGPVICLAQPNGLVRWAMGTARANGPAICDNETYRPPFATGTALAPETPGRNPYAAPVALSDRPLTDAPWTRTPWLRRLVVLQAVVIITSLVAEAYKHESIITSGPIFSLVGLAIAIVGFRNSDYMATAFGGSAIAFALLIVFLINYNSWGPVQGDRPITLLAFGYAAFALPISARLVLARSASSEVGTAEASGASGEFEVS